MSTNRGTPEWTRSYGSVKLTHLHRSVWHVPFSGVSHGLELGVARPPKRASQTWHDTWTEFTIAEVWSEFTSACKGHIFCQLKGQWSWATYFLSGSCCLPWLLLLKTSKGNTPNRKTFALHMTVTSYMYYTEMCMHGDKSSDVSSLLASTNHILLLRIFPVSLWIYLHSNHPKPSFCLFQVFSLNKSHVCGHQ